ncbi:MAG: DMT family transporter [Beijerinckiaceae bacterium]|jgi:drug/metabolite transporter (DMT)-like permease
MTGKQDPASAQDAGASLFYAALPATFVLFWSTGFIAGKQGLQDAAPFTFLLYRFLIVAALLTLVAWIARAPWPPLRALAPLAIGGVFVHAGYLGATFGAMSLGVEAGVSSLMAGLQPVLTAVFAAPFLGERVSGRQWAGLALGMAGVTLVVWNKLGLGLGTPAGMALSFMSAVFMTAGTLWQKRFGGAMDLRTGSVAQFAASALVMLPLAAWEGFRVEWTASFIGAMGWLCLVLSVGTISVLFVLIRRGAAAEVASLFFLVPPTTAILAWLMFGETLGPVALAGMALVVVAVAMVTWKPRPRAA